MNLFVELPDHFTRAEAVLSAKKINVSVSSVEWMLLRSIDKWISVSYTMGNYSNTKEGKAVRAVGKMD